MKKEALRVTSTIPVAPTTLYFAWIDSDHHSAMTGATAKIEQTVGGKYSACNGYVTGKLVILDLGRRIVMSWRTSDFPRDAADSRVEVHFETLGSSTRLLILHTDIPEGQSEKYKALWNDTYITPMRAYFSKFLPDPRNPPVRRPPPPVPDEEEQEEPEEVPKRPLREARDAKEAARASATPKSVAHVTPSETKAEPRMKPAKATTKKAPPVEVVTKKAASKKPEAKKAVPKKKPASAKATKAVPKKKPAPSKSTPKKATKKKAASSKPAKKAAKKPASKPTKPKKKAR